MNDILSPELEQLAQRLCEEQTELLWNCNDDCVSLPEEENMSFIRKALLEAYNTGRSDEATDEYNRTVE